VTRRKEPRDREYPRFPRSVSTFNVEQVKVLNTLDRSPEKDAAAVKYLTRHGGSDLLNILGLR
jgi:hypothetical protein